MEFKKDRSSPSIITITHEDGLTLNAAEGTIDAELTNDLTDLMVDEGYYWDVYLFAPAGGDVTRIAEGFSPVSPRITSTTT